MQKISDVHLHTNIDKSIIGRVFTQRLPLNKGTASHRSTTFFPEKYPNDNVRNNKGKPSKPIIRSQTIKNAPKRGKKYLKWTV